MISIQAEGSKEENVEKKEGGSQLLHHCPHIFPRISGYTQVFGHYHLWLMTYFPT